MVLVRLGEAEPAAVLAGAVPVHFPASVSAIHKDERPEIDKAQSLARNVLGEAAYNSALRQGAAMDEEKVANYALREFRRLAPPAEPYAQRPETRQACRRCAADEGRSSRSSRSSRAARTPR